MSSLSEDPRYGFAVGRIRALEPALMDRAKYERLVRARGGEEFVAVLAETPYGRFLEGGSADVSQAFDKAAEESAAFLSQHALDEWLMHLFQVPAAVRRLKASLKDALSQGMSDVAIPDELRDTESLARVGSVVAGITEAFVRSHDPAAVDPAVDRLAQELQLRIAGPSEFMTGYLGLHADVENLRTLVRLKAQPGAEEDRYREMEAAFLCGGTLALNTMVATLSEAWPAALELLSKAPPHGAGNEAFREYLEHGHGAVTDKHSFIRMERLGREVELRYLRQTRFATFGHEPLVAFFLLRENELRNLRLLYAAKLAGLADQETRDLVAYVE